MSSDVWRVPADDGSGEVEIRPAVHLLSDGRIVPISATRGDWTLERDSYENGSPCWCVSAGDREANFSHYDDAALFLRAVTNTF